MKAENNFLVSLYLRDDHFIHKKPGQSLNIVDLRGQMLPSAGCSVIDLITCENYSYDVYSNIEDQGLAIDETFAFYVPFNLVN